jgi:serine/threonine protein kinase
MNGVRNDPADRPQAGESLASWYIPGRPDGFGDRLLMFDNTDTPSLELLRFRADLTSTPGFEEVLRDRVSELQHFQHPMFAPVRALQHLDDGDALALVSVHAPGQRLSELFTQRPRKALHPRLVTWLLRELTPALAALHAQGPDVSHGALTPDRIVFTSEGRLCIVEHVLGSALKHLQLPPAQLWREFGLVALPPNVPVAQLDPRVDVIQLAGVALSMLLARPVTLDDLRHRLPKLLDEFSELSTPASAHHVPPLRLWLERALQLNGTSYKSAADAEQDLRELPTGLPSSSVAAPAVRVMDTAAAAPRVVPPPAPAQEEKEQTGRAPARTDNREATPIADKPVVDRAFQDLFPPEARPRDFSARPPKPAPRAPEPFQRVGLQQAPWPRQGKQQQQAREPRAPFPVRRRWLPRVTTIAAALGAIALLEAAVIALMGIGAIGRPAAVVIESPRPGDTVFVNGEAVGPTPFQLKVGSGVRSVSVVPAAPAGGSSTEPATASVAVNGSVRGAGASTPPQKPGGVRLISSIPLTVLEGDRVLGSTDTAVFATPGSHQLELVNAELGYRATLNVVFRDGEIRPMRVNLPTGRLNVNAQPWATVSVDGREIGETPLANIELSIGPHVVVLRHPQLGERTETVVVRADTVARFTHAFQ